MPQKALDALREASQSLLYPSESDEPFEPVSWGSVTGELSPARVRQAVGAGPGKKVEEIALEEFFKSLTQRIEGAPEEEDPGKFKALQAVVNQHLQDTKVFRVGSVNIDVYVVGKSVDGEWVGLKTKAIET
jgi:Nuclease A inhibitor-like protein